MKFRARAGHGVGGALTFIDHIQNTQDGRRKNNSVRW